MPKGNGQIPTYKQQKNVCVYIGKRGGEEDELLQLIARFTQWSESRIFRECYIEKMIRWGMIDPHTKKPIPEAVEKLRQRLDEEGSKGLPDMLDR